MSKIKSHNYIILVSQNDLLNNIKIGGRRSSRRVTLARRRAGNTNMAAVTPNLAGALYKAGHSPLEVTQRSGEVSLHDGQHSSRSQLQGLLGTGSLDPVRFYTLVVIPVVLSPGRLASLQNLLKLVNFPSLQNPLTTGSLSEPPKPSRIWQTFRVSSIPLGARRSRKLSGLYLALVSPTGTDGLPRRPHSAASVPVRLSTA